MGTLASNRKGYITGDSSSSYSDALSGSSGTASDSANSNVNTAIQYFKSTGRGGGTHRFVRTFLHFNTSGISGGSSFQIQLTSTAGNSSDGQHNIIAIKHSAGSSNGSELANADFDNIDKNTLYSSSTAYGSSGTQTISLNATAATQIINNNDFNIALVLLADQAEESEDPLEESGDISNGIAFGSAINLVYTDPASGYAGNVIDVSSGQIGKVIDVATASIAKINDTAGE